MITKQGWAWLPWRMVVLGLLGLSRPVWGVEVDLSGYRADCGVTVRSANDRLEVDWPMETGVAGRLVLDVSGTKPLIESLAVQLVHEAQPAVILTGLDPAVWLTVGSRVPPAGRPPEMSPFNVFFDSPAKRPFQTYRSKLDLKRVRVTSQGRRATIVLGNLSLGSFEGELWLTVYAGARLVHVEAVVRTYEDLRAIVYDAGLVGPATEPGWTRLNWIDTEGQPRARPILGTEADESFAVRHRVAAIQANHGSLACFPPPHQYFYPRDLTDNQETIWAGANHRGSESRFGFGIRQTETGGGSFVPWFNAPPGTDQHLGVFYLLSRGTADEALRQALRFTRGDRFADVPGHVTFSSHWHMAIAVAAMKEQAEGKPRTRPDFVRMFKEMNVEIVHLAEFHGDGHPQDPGPLRLPELDAMFAECRRLSDDEILFLPGEEANVYLGGPPMPGRHPGHWLYLFPRPVAWIMKREASQPFAEPSPKYGTLYRVGNRDEMLRLLEQEQGLAWTAHPRIKASSWAPDAYRTEDFFRSPHWLGAAWKAMPADLSRPRLGERVLDLLDDMANWGARKYVLGEVDVFKLDHTHELYGHMNINYLRLPKVPRYGESWQPVLDALRNGQFFVSTGEILIEQFTVGGQPSGSTLPPTAGDKLPLLSQVSWTFPLRFAEVVTGDGTKVSRQTIDLADTEAFGRRTISLTPNLDGQRWIRFAVWDIAGNGAFTQPIWLTASP